jgi:8-oxo-dGTP pyrophosphatase MutT (NUDIX family)
MGYSCFAVIVRKAEHGDEVLMVLNKEKMITISGESDMRRAFRSKQKGWGFPGGSSEKGEEPGEVVVREADEEVGIAVAVKDDTPHFRTPAQGDHTKVFFLIDHFEGTPHVNCQEITAVAWMPLSVVLSSGEEEETGTWYVDEKDNQKKRRKRMVVRYDGDEVYGGHRFGIRELLRKLGKLPT